MSEQGTSGIQTRSRAKSESETKAKVEQLTLESGSITAQPTEDSREEKGTSNTYGMEQNLQALVALLADKMNSEVGGKGAETVLPDFDGEVDVEQWIKNFEANADAYKWTNMQKFVFATNKMTKAAKLFLQTVTITNYEDLKKNLLKEFRKVYNSAEVHDQLRERRKQSNESFLEYVIKMRQIGVRANVDDEAIIRYIVDGVMGKRERKSGMYSAKNFSDLKREYEIYQHINNEYQHSTRKFDTDKNKKKEHCFNCGSSEHKRSECKAESPKCFKCNKMGHISKDCTAEPAKKVAYNSSQNSKNVIKVIIANKVQIPCLIDTGAEISLIKKSIAKKLGASVKTYNNAILGLGGKITPIGIVQVDLVLDGTEINHNFVVVPDIVMSYEAIIGFDIINQFRYFFDESGFTFTSLMKNDPMQHMVMNIFVEDEYEVPQEYEKQIRELVSAHKPKAIEQEPPIAMKINLISDKKIQHLPKRACPTEREVIRKQVKEWLENGIIRPSSAEYCSRLVVVSKKDGTNRICVDFRDLNKIVQKDRFPVPLMEEVIEEIKDAVVFSIIDLENANFHVPVEEESKKYTTFTCREGLYEFNKAPFGFCNSPAAFLRYIHWVFRNLLCDSVVQIYMDDIIIYSKTEEEGLEKLKKVLDVAAENGLNIKWKKCKFLQRRVKFLRFLLENGNISPDETKVVAINNFPKPKNVKDVQSFLGLTGFFRKFVKNYAMLTEPLSALLKKDATFQIDRK